jgi:hypothetical protein
MVTKAMKAETPAEGIVKRHDWGDSMVYNVPCTCGDNEHSHDVWIEKDDTGVVVNIHTIVKSQWWKINRLQVIWRLLTRGYAEYETSLIMTEQQALNYAETLKTAIKDVQEFKSK